MAFAAGVAICVHVAMRSDERSRMKLASLLELSAQVRLIWVAEAAEAMRFPGAAGKVTVALLKRNQLMLAISAPAVAAVSNDSRSRCTPPGSGTPGLGTGCPVVAPPGFGGRVAPPFAPPTHHRQV